MKKEHVHTAIILVSNTYYHDKYIYGGNLDDDLFKRTVMKLDNSLQDNLFKITYDNVGSSDEDKKITVSIFRIVNKGKNELIERLNDVVKTTDFEYCHLLFSGYYKKTKDSFIDFYTNNYPLEHTISLYEVLNILETFSLQYLYIYVDCCNLGESKQRYDEKYFAEKNIIILKSQFRCTRKKKVGSLIEKFCNYFVKYYYGKKYDMTYNFSGNFLLILSIIKDRLRETQKKFLETKLNEDQWASLIKSENSTTKLVLNKMCLDLFKLNINRKFLNNFEIRVYSYRQNKNTSDEIDKEIDTFFRNLGSYCVLSINDMLID